MPWRPVEVLAGVPVYQAEQATALLRVAGIAVNVRKVADGGPPSCSMYVAAVDEEQALQLLAAHWFPVSTVPAAEAVILRPSAGAEPGDDVWSLLTEQEPQWPTVYSFP
jgi:hypothetical protein